MTDPSPPPEPDDDVARYDFDLPPDRIAQRPADRRDASRLMVLDPGQPPRHARFADLPDRFRPGDLLVRNDTRVFPARLLGNRPGGGKVELLLVRPADAATPETPAAPEVLSGEAEQEWLALARPAGRLRTGMRLTFGDSRLSSVIGERDAGLPPGMVRVTLECRTPGGVAAAVERFGQVPLPPYIRREGQIADADDRERYQTLYAGPAGAVAAPTAGLHFTPEVDRELLRRGVRFARVTLHVGPGTFRPVATDRLSDHPMDAEWYAIPPETRVELDRTRREGGRIVAVGTTSVRALEAAAADPAASSSGWTSLFIRPGFRFRVVDGLVTNFHLPRSSLLALVSALVGRERLLSAYREAMAEGYRFYSYGDAMLAWGERGIP